MEFLWANDPRRKSLKEGAGAVGAGRGRGRGRTPKAKADQFGSGY